MENRESLKITARVLCGIGGGLTLLYRAIRSDSALLLQLPDGRDVADPLRAWLFLLFPALLAGVLWLERATRENYLRTVSRVLFAFVPFVLLWIRGPLWMERSVFVLSSVFFLILLVLQSSALQRVAEDLVRLLSQKAKGILILFLTAMALFQLVLFLRLGEDYSAFILQNDLPNVRKGRMPGRFALILILLAAGYFLCRRFIPARDPQPQKEGTPHFFRPQWKSLLRLPSGIRIPVFLIAVISFLFYLYFVDPFLGFRQRFSTQIWILLIAGAGILAFKDELLKFYEGSLSTAMAVLLLALLCGAIPYFIVTEAVGRLDLFLPQELDIGIQNQVMWTLAFQGTPQLAMGSQDGVYNTHYFRDHVPLFYFLLAPLYRLEPSPQGLIYLQSFFLYLGIIPWILLVRQIAGSWNLAFFAGLIYLFYPALQILQLFDVHEAVFSIPLFLTALVFLEARRTSPRPRAMEAGFALFLFLAGLVREEMGLFAVSLGLFLFARREIRPATIALILGIGQFVVMSIIIQRSFGSGGHYERYVPLFFKEGDYSIFSILQLLVFNPVYFFTHWWDPAKLLFLLKLSTPLLFLVFGDRKYIFLYLAGFASTILATSAPNWTQGYQYSVLLVVAFFYASFLTLRRFSDAGRRLAVSGMLIASFFSMIATGVFLAPLYRLSFLGPYAPLKGEVVDRWIHLSRRPPPDTFVALRSLLRAVPRRVSIGVNEPRLLPLLSGRPAAHTLPTHKLPECVVQYPPFGGHVMDEDALRRAGYRLRLRQEEATLHCQAHVP
ncbi:MAG: DUF2079 domain-containing protein [Spirochaetales bacterium]|nr:DUF2079 domain-containing protein [Spirochaetales bacterium]